MSQKPKAPPTPHGRLDFIRPRVTKRIQRAREGRMAHIVKRLRIWLPAIAVVVVVSLLIWPTLLPDFQLKDITKNVPDLVIDNLHYSGVDNKNQPYSLVAAQATKPSSLQGIYDLVKPEGDITLKNGRWLDSKANYGRYDEAHKKLWLGGNVQIFRDDGYQMTTNEAQVNLNTNEAWGDKDVLIQGAMGTIRGTGFRFMNGGHIIIRGPAKANLRLHKGPISDKTSLP